MRMNKMCIIQVNVPIEMAPHLSERMVGGQEGGAIPRLLFMDIPQISSFIHLPVNRYLHHLLLLAVINKAAKHLCVINLLSERRLPRWRQW